MVEYTTASGLSPPLLTFVLIDFAYLPRPANFSRAPDRQSFADSLDAEPPS